MSREERESSIWPIEGLSIGRVKDRFIWAYNDNGTYSVKSGFWFVSNHIALPSSSNASTTSGNENLDRWTPPMSGTIKCNVNSTEYLSNILFHARDAFTKSLNRIVSELRCWPKYCFLLEQICHLQAGFAYCAFKLESIKANFTARAIASSVTRDGRFNSYLAAGGLAWLHDLLAREAMA
ncbi:hypothetical protein AALP_AA8G456200 [Arabis alpina]|uniref:Uncharacterized protein n=1 Tax=Arabis alpina TaxID=50452 RepID=A0A087GDM8_ARAAL|nr:hypothetical protein AALP_AA8G456200 [Arabis alpina]